MNTGYSIGELAKEAGVSIRTIRFYIDEGLLPPPPVHGRNTFYDDEYLERLKLIRRLKGAFLPLREIQEKMQELSIEEVRSLLAVQDLPVDQPAGRIAEASLEEDASRAERQTTPSTPPTGEDAVEYIARILDAHNSKRNATILQKQDSSFFINMSGTPPESPTGILPSPAIRRPAAGEEKATSRPEKTPTIRPTQSSWQRIIIIPGIELHVSESVYTEKRAAIQRLVEWARQLFGSKMA